MGIPLRPLTPNSNRKPMNFGVTDIEAYKWINFLIIGYYAEVLDKHGNVTDEILETFEDMTEYAYWVFSERQPHDVIMAHFGGKYDFNFIMKEFFLQRQDFLIHNIIPRGSGLLSMKVSKVFESPHSPRNADEEKRWIKSYYKGTVEYHVYSSRTIEFRDSSGLLPFSLASITQNFDVETKKGTIDYETMDKVTPEVIDYLVSDLKGLYQSLRKFFDWDLVKKAGPASTMASQALKVYRTYMHTPIPSLKDEVDTFVRGAYFGGRTEIFKPFFDQPDDYTLLKTYDVNSLYPYVMASFDYPTKFIGWTTEFIPGCMGFYDVEVEIPKMYIPPLGTVFDPEGWGRFIFPTGRIRGRWSSIELEYAMSLGVKILKIHQGALFKNGGPIFKAYITDLYTKRKLSKPGSVDDIICKLLMNSLYGRFGLDLVREQLEFDNGQPFVTPHIEIPISDDGNTIFRLVKKEIFLDSTFTNVAIAAWVTSHARIHMHKQYMLAPEQLYYTDTDSLFTTFTFNDNDKALGELKLEYKSREACFLLPKTYIAETLGPYWTGFEDDGKTTFKTSKKVVMKGFDKKKISKFTIEDFFTALEGDMRRLKTTNPEKFATFKTAAKHNKFLMLLKESPREIRSRYDKRNVIQLENGKWDTEPLHVEDGVIVNRYVRSKSDV